MKIEHVEGTDVGKLMLYALSTCIWCRKTKQLLTDMGVAYDYVFVDLLTGQDKEDVVSTVTKWNPDCSFPTLVINEDKCIVGYKEKEIKEAVKV
ncbi:MAG: glutaredoxin family protein [Dehalococcoidia bacterium]|nr:glutaredoxin family protein [Dehalococcoidia bacterium]